ncbi:protein NODULATION SIGNALING PATHWAY 2-like [Tasmannia lanceolata]|uniref:protein NODULATION SIGNALING PATHWAY 2-like n=1 Tax=Tasmannia lanceolata TaxID=3420 RepID=UPI0040643B5D
MDPQFSQLSWPDYSFIDFNPNEELPFQNIMSPSSMDDDLFTFPMEEESALNLDELGLISNADFSNFENEGWVEENSDDPPLQHHSFNEEVCMSSPMKSSSTSMDETSFNSSLVCPNEEMEVDNQIGIIHLLKAYGDAREKGYIELAEVIVRRICEKVSPVGSTMERVGYYLFQGLDKQSDYLKQESSKNYPMASQAYCQICPYTMFAHFTANKAILEAIPEDVEIVHIVDLGMREGAQWPPLLKALGLRRRVWITSINSKEGHGSDRQGRFEETQKRLCNYARSIGVGLKVDEMDMEELLTQKKGINKRGRGREWLVFNSMVGLPHMGLERSRREVLDFLSVAKELINNSSSHCGNINSNRGIITVGNGDGVEMSMGNGNSGFGSFFEGCLLHFHALFESMEWHFPPHLSLARTAMECLFVAPSVSSPACFHKWEERQETCGVPSELGLVGWRLSKENFLGAKEIVREGEGGLYEVKIGGECENTMTLEWRGTPLVRVSAWR